ncbi:MAG TPA: LamG-like jellyroll fold domain-containing protein [Anaerolineae bacterium]|nr:LamG-like jellyroll fold domain-containing protein [Anaerolineae bacterium]
MFAPISGANSAQDDIETVWRRTGQAATFRFTTDALQTTHLVPHPANVGRRQRTDQLTLASEVDSVNETMTMSLETTLGGTRRTLDAKAEDGTVYLQNTAGEWEENPELLNLVAPGGDPMGYLNAMENVQQLPSGQNPTDGTATFLSGEQPEALIQNITRYAFTLDGPQLAAYVQEQSAEYLRNHKGMPNVLETESPELYKRAVGRGELWVDTTTGLPLQQRIQIEFPPEKGALEYQSVAMLTRFENWELRAAAQLANKLGHTIEPIVIGLMPSPPNLERLALNLAIISLVIVISYSLARSGQNPRVYRLVAITIVLATLVTPFGNILTNSRVSAFFDRIGVEQAEKEATNAEIEAYQTEINNAVSNDFQPNISPLEQTDSNQDFEAFGREVTPATASTGATTGTDTDLDFLNDEVEIYKLGTFYDAFDTDGDFISDGSEVYGFVISGTTWYLDPWAYDSNGDSLSDLAECPQRVDTADDGTAGYDDEGAQIDGRNNVCQDTDGDGVPDVWDFDNDGDGVPDAVDSSPYDADELSATARDSFNLTVTDYDTDELLLLDLRIRPENPDHLWLAGNVYDWPANDDNGQVTRVLTNTFADYSYNMTNASNGDLMVIPQIEITIPYDASNPSGGLPISSTVTITASTPTSDWLDTSILDEFDITVSKDTETGDLYVYTSVYDIQDDVGDSVVAWQALMPYRPSVANWGNDHQYRLVWMVLALTDDCDTSGMADGDIYSEYCDPTNTNNWTTSETIVQTYYENFYVTGMSIDEEAGLTGAYVAQFNETSQSYPEELWHLTDSVFDIMSAGLLVTDTERFSINDVVERFDNDSTVYTDGAPEKWGIASTSLNVISYTYDNVTIGVVSLAEELESFLDLTFPSVTSSDYVTVLQLRESATRSSQLFNTETNYDIPSNTVTLSFSDTNESLYTALVWSTYQKTVDGWENADEETYMDWLETSLSTEFTDDELASQFDATVNSDVARYVAIDYATKFYLSMETGNVSLVDFGGVASSSDIIDDADYTLQTSDEAALLIAKESVDYFFNFIENTSTVILDGVEIAIAAYYTIDTVYDLLNSHALKLASVDTDVSLTISADEFVDEVVAVNLATAQMIKYVHVNWGHTGKFSLVGAGLMAGFVLFAIIISIGLSLSGDHDAGIATILLVTALLSTVALIRVSFQMFRLSNALLKFRQLTALIIAADGGEGVSSLAVWTTLNKLYSALSNVTKALAVNVLIDSIISIVVALVVFLVIAMANKWTEKDIEYQIFWAYTLASITVAAIIFVFFAILLVIAALAATGVGLIVVIVFIVIFAIIAIVDLIMYAVCYFSGADNVEEGEDLPFICKGIIGSLVYEIADAIYEYHNPIDFDNEDRLQIDIAGIDLVDEADGFRVGNQLNTTMTVESRLYPNQPKFDFYWRSDIGGSKVKPEHLDLASFLYTLNSSISVFDIPNSTSWNENSADKYLYHTYTLTEQINLDTAGINTAFDYQLGEAFSIPLMNCWWVFSEWVCNLASETESATIHDLDEVFALDVFPATFGEFVELAFEVDDGWRMAWDEQFPVLMDADGDGLISSYYNGADPDDSTPDTDGDGLSDYYEETNNANGFNSTLADSDGDGLSDYWELFYGTDVNDSDTDNDGLLDGEEVFHPDRHPGDKTATETFSGGWDIVYDYADDKTPYIWHVSSNLEYKDVDGDDNYDYYEYIYRYNPNVLNDLEIFTIQESTFTYPGTAGYAKPGNTIPYEMVLFGELDSLLVSYGLLEAELPRDVVQEQQAFTLVGQDTLTLTGSLYVDPAVLSTTQAVSMTLRAGAYTEPVTPNSEASNVFVYLPFSKLINTNNPYEYYDFFPDLSGNNRNWRCQACPTVSNGVTEFNGASVIYTEPYIAGLSPYSQVDVTEEAEWSLSMWVKPDSATSGDSGSDELLSIEYIAPFSSVLTNVLTIELTNLTRMIWSETKINNSCAPTTVVGGQVTYNQWNHIVYTYDGQYLTMYVNGEAGMPVAANKICDSYHVQLNTIGQNLVGEMRDYVGYTSALTAEAIRREAYRGFRRFDLNLDEPPASQSFADSRGFALTATCNSNQNQCPLTGIAGVSQQAVLFDGNDKLRISADSDAFGLAINDAGVEDFRHVESSFTVMGWVAAESWDSGDVADSLFSFAGSDVGTAYPINNNTSDYYVYTYTTNMRFGFSNGVPSVAIDNSIVISDDSNTSTTPTDESFSYYQPTPIQLATDSLHHVAFVYDANATEISIYVDGVLENQGTLLNSTHVAIPDNMTLNIGDGYHGMLDHFVLSTRVHTVDEIQAIMKELPAVNLHLDEDIDTTTFVNSGIETLTFSCSGADCPSAGVDGQMREAARFSQDGALDDKISATSPTIANDDYTVGFWFYSEDTLAEAQTLFADDGNGYQPVIRLESDRTLSFLYLRSRNDGNCTRTYRQYQTTGTFDEEQWQHVVFVFNVATEQVTAFINGVETALTLVGDSTEACPTVQDHIIIGESFIGQIDEIVYYQSELLDFEAESIFDYQSAWYDIRVQPSLQIDADKPVVVLDTGTRFHPGTYQDTMLPIYVADVGAGVEEIVIKTFRNGQSLPDETTTLTRTTDTDYWIFTIPSRYNGGSADLVFQYYAVDGVGNKSDIDYAFIWGDNQLPSVSIDSVVTVSDAVTMTGNIDDGNSSDDSGVVTDTFKLRLTHQNGVEQTAVYATVPAANGDWAQTFAFNNIFPYGTFNVEAYVEDVAGNVMNFEVIDTVNLDVLAPFADIAAPTSEISASTSVLVGAFHQLGYPVDAPSLSLHFDEPEPLYDSSGTANAVTCTTCPTTTAFGQYDTAATFAGSEDLAVAFTNKSEELTLMGWFRPTWGAIGYDPVLFSHEITGTDRLTVSVAADLNYLYVDDGSTTTTITHTLTANSWQHIAFLIDDKGYIALYVDGEQVAWEQQIISGVVNGSVWVGSAFGSSGFIGNIDDVTVYDRALLDTDIYDIVHPVDDTISLDQLYIRFRHIGETITPTWETVTVTAGSNLYATWQHLVPDNHEGPYRIEMLAQDSAGYERTSVAWSGNLDNMTPRVSLELVSESTVVCTVADYNLDIASVDCPIDPVISTTVTADSLSWYSDTFGTGIGPVISWTITGTWATGVPTDTSAIACDTLGQCQNSDVTIAYNRAPVATDDAYTLNDSTVLVVDSVALGLLDNDLDLDADSLAVTAMGTPLYGSVEFNSDGTFTYTSNDGDAHTDVFTYTISDGDKSDTGNIMINMNSCRALKLMVATETEFNNALDCYDTETTGSYYITLTADINLTTRINGISYGKIDLTIDGDGHTVSYNGQERLFSIVYTPHVVTFTNITLADGYYPYTSTGGPAIYVKEGNVVILDSTLENNVSEGYGGAIHADDTILHIENSLFYSNTSRYGGGALYLLSDNTVFITNTTFYNNSAGTGGAEPAVIFANNRTHVNMYHVTMDTDNSSATYGVFVDSNSYMTMTNSVIAGFPTNCATNGTNGMLTSGGYNLTDDSSCAAIGSDIVNTDPLLGALQDNGGPTWTQLPLYSESPLIDGAGSCAVARDQRGELRDDGACDIGAVEIQPFVLSISYNSTLDTILDWNNDFSKCDFRVRRSSSPYQSYTQIADDITDLSYIDLSGTMGDTATNSFYRVVGYDDCAIDTAGINQTNRVGEFDFAIVAGN